METKKKNFPETLETGMKVTAVCMGREVGNYIVTQVSTKFAVLEVESDPDCRSIFAARSVGSNGLVTVTSGAVPIQATDYFVKPYEQ